MHSTSKAALLIVFSAFFASLVSACAPTAPETAFNEPDRTANRSVSAASVQPGWMFNTPDYYEFSPLVSNSDPMTQHPHQWDGQNWNTAKWNPRWTPTIAIRKFYNAGIFAAGQPLEPWTKPTVVLGPTFYQLSDLDQRRTLKLLVDYMAYLKEGYSYVSLVDWHTKDVVGAYTAQGMFLN
ncbi:MAG: hypothetical protein KGL10_00215 [Alphaproteobacteria bacterium]|nr:hypothetical protein [Alphaproteobacteria bacterium]MDE2335715.1 hypothetical protein [Alphaproteobacteria bacterium]